MTESKGNEPAFPTSIWRWEGGFQIGNPMSGLSKREYFAAAALQGWAAGRNNGAEFGDAGRSTPEFVAESCFRYADAMLAEMDKPK